MTGAQNFDPVAEILGLILTLARVGIAAWPVVYNRYKVANANVCMQWMWKMLCCWIPLTDRPLAFFTNF